MTTYYVATTGSNGNNGTSVGTPWATMAYAATQNLLPGDTVEVASGTYNINSVTLSKSGSAGGGYITFKSTVKHGAKITCTGQYGFNMAGNYQKVDGFEISGATAAGVVSSNKHHATIANCHIYDSVGAAISCNYGEYYLIEGNTVHGNCNGINARSGISIYHARNLTANNNSGFRNIIRGNTSYDNYVLVSNHIDANGIIIDDFKSLQSPEYDNYTFPTLIENNVCYRNGGSGILVFQSDYVTVRNNTAYQNSYDTAAAKSSTWRPELQNRYADNNTWLNNIAVSDTSRSQWNTTIGSLKNSSGGNNVVWKNNLTWTGTVGDSPFLQTGGAQIPSGADNLLGVNPGFTNAGTRDFTLALGSAAIGAGIESFGIGTVDFSGNPRKVSTVDIGAYEYQGTPVTPGDMSPDSIVCAYVVSRVAQTDMSVVSPGTDFVNHTVKNTIPAAYTGSTDNTLIDSFGPITKTFDTTTQGHFGVVFSVKSK